MANFAQLGIQIDSNADQAASSLENLAAAGAKAEKSTERLSKASSDLSAEQQKINARAAEMAAQDARRAASAQKANNSIRDQQQELSKLLGTIDPTVAALDRLDQTERKLASFRRSGAIDTESYTLYNNKLKEQRELLGGVSAGINRAGMSQRAYNAALRNVPAQFTDIAVSLQGGQAPLTVLLQQGGQLKDMFGGIGPAFRALGGYIVGLINPVTVLGAAVGTLGVAWYQAGRQQEDLEKALISSGRYAASSSEELNRLADAYDNIDGVTRGKALDALTQVAASGRLTGEQFRLATESALRWSAVTGDSVDTITSKFNDIARDPVNALLKLNETERFLTQTQYERVKALQEEGRFQDAATEAARIYADTVNGRATEIEASLGLVSTAWKNIKNETGEAWDAVVSGINRAQGPLQAFADRVAGLSELQRKFVVGTIGALSLPAGIVTRFGGNAFRGVSSSVDSTAGSGDTAAIDSESVKRLQDANRQWEAIVGNSNRHAQIENEVLRIRKAGLAAGINELDIEKRVTEYRTKQAEIDAKKNKPKANSDANSAETLLNTALRQVEANNQLAETGDKVSASQRLVIQINQRLADTTNTMTEAQRRELIAARESLAVTDQQAKSRQQLTKDLSANAAIVERIAGLTQQQGDQNRVALMGIGRGGDAAPRAQAELSIRKSYLDEVDKLEKLQRNENTKLSQQEYDAERQLLDKYLSDRLSAENQFNKERMAAMGNWQNGFRAAYEDFAFSASNVAGATQGVFQNAFQGATDSLVSFVTTGKQSFGELTASILSDLARIFAQQQLVGLVGSISGGGGNTGTISSLFGGDWGFSAGGYTGDGSKYQPKGIVHAGEVVWSQRDVAAVGGPRAANAMRPTAGYANGGGPGLPQSRSIGQLSAPQITFNMNMQDGTISSNQQGGTPDDGTRELKQMFEAMINQWWQKNSRTGGAVYNLRTGTA